MKFPNFIFPAGFSFGLMLWVGLPLLFASPVWGNDAKVPGTPYHATGNISCSMGSGKTQSCPFGVIRQGYKGDGTVVVTTPNGNKRSIIFKKGKAISYDQSKTKAGKFSASRQGDMNLITIGQEKYEIPDAVIFGG
jgi:hypothetical protein